MLATFFSISWISTARRPSGFEIRCKKRFDLLKLEDLQSPNNNKRKSILFCCGAKYKLYLPDKEDLRKAKRTLSYGSFR